jgi:ribosomal protein L24E
MPKCSFSGEDIKKGTGIMYVLKDGKVLHFKNTKCLKNHIKLKRKPLTTRWTQSYKLEKEKRLVTLKTQAKSSSKTSTTKAVKAKKPAQ